MISGDLGIDGVGFRVIGRVILGKLVSFVEFLFLFLIRRCFVVVSVR